MCVSVYTSHHLRLPSPCTRIGRLPIFADVRYSQNSRENKCPQKLPPIIIIRYTQSSWIISVPITNYYYAYLSLGKEMVVIGAPFTSSVHVSVTVPQSGPTLLNLRRHSSCAYARSSAKGMT